MRLWFAHPPADPLPALDPACAIGRVGAVESAGPGDPLPLTGPGAEGWLVMPGLGADGARVGALAATGLPVLVAVNGLGDRAVADLRQAAGDRLVLAFDARGIGQRAVLEQLAWLSAQPEPFAVIGDDGDVLIVAAAFGPWGLVVTGGGLDFAAVLRLAVARRKAAPRPISPAELDAVAGRELCLTVVVAKQAGEVLDAADFGVAFTEYRGLAPAMRGYAIGRRLRYPVAPGEALHFGHLDDADAC